MTKTILMFGSCFLLLFNVPYLLKAWTYSRLDRPDILFYLLSIPAVFFAAGKLSKDKMDYTALLLLIPSALLFSGKSLHQVNALSILASLSLIWSIFWLLCSWNYARQMLPVFVILALGTPSTTYQTALLLKCSVTVAILVKFLLAAGCFFWIYANKRYKLEPGKNALFFAAAAIVTTLFLFHSEELYFSGQKFFPAFPMKTGNFIGRKLEPDANTKRFFATSLVHQYRYTSRKADIAVLEVLCGKDIHEIHPASHCLRTSQWEISSEKLLYLREDFAVTEINAVKGHARILVWVWYSSHEFSTASFTGFRRRYRPGNRYGTWQISTPVTENISTSRETLRQFVNSLPQEIKK